MCGHFTSAAGVFRVCTDYIPLFLADKVNVVSKLNVKMKSVEIPYQNFVSK